MQRSICILALLGCASSAFSQAFRPSVEVTASAPINEVGPWFTRRVSNIEAEHGISGEVLAGPFEGLFEVYPHNPEIKFTFTARQRLIPPNRTYTFTRAGAAKVTASVYYDYNIRTFFDCSVDISTFEGAKFGGRTAAVYGDFRGVSRVTVDSDQSENYPALVKDMDYTVVLQSRAWVQISPGVWQAEIKFLNPSSAVLEARATPESGYPCSALARANGIYKIRLRSIGTEIYGDSF